MLLILTLIVMINLVYSVQSNGRKEPMFVNLNWSTIQQCGNNSNEKKKKKKRHKAIFKSNIVYKKFKENIYPFKKYNIDDIYYGRILSINKSKIKIDILCDRKAYLNTSEYFCLPTLQKYINFILHVHNIIKVRIKHIHNIHKKIIVDIQKYTYEEIISSFKNNFKLLNARIFLVNKNYVLLYIGPKIHGKLILHKEEDMDMYTVGSDIPVRIDYFDKGNNELYVSRP
ncbi:conserved Plasmodium protein, unknown function [Plasmodium ovale]|uniref:S1 motif domain-containing protein n=1 Tax=Plasmodium ovale TaxID=36330 RepID=A0A1C3KMN9_PLAOA|nr:conserved Plasmodium protein, unknown function [Plasmodium ovale]